MCDVFLLIHLHEAQLTDLPDYTPLNVSARIIDPHTDVSDSVSGQREILESSVLTRGLRRYVLNSSLETQINISAANELRCLHIRAKSVTGSILAEGSIVIPFSAGRWIHNVHMARPEFSRPELLLHEFLGEVPTVIGAGFIPCGHVKIEINLVARNFSDNNFLT
jgi:hypothetical protein